MKIKINNNQGFKSQIELLIKKTMRGPGSSVSLTNNESNNLKPSPQALSNKPTQINLCPQEAFISVKSYKLERDKNTRYGANAVLDCKFKLTRFTVANANRLSQDVNKSICGDSDGCVYIDP